MEGVTITILGNICVKSNILRLKFIYIVYRFDDAFNFANMLVTRLLAFPERSSLMIV